LGGGMCPSSNFLNKHYISEVGSISIFRQRSTYAGGPYTSSYSQSLCTTQAVNLLIYAPENRPCARVITWKWLLKI